MNKLKQFAWNYVLPIIPFSMFHKGVCDEWTKQAGEILSSRKFLINSTVTAITIAIPVVYSIRASQLDEWNYNNWPKIENQMKINRYKQFKVQTSKIFNEADVDKNNTLDSAEFLPVYTKLYTSCTKKSNEFGTAVIPK